MKRIISFLLALAMISAFLPVCPVAQAAEPERISGQAWRRNPVYPDLVTFATPNSAWVDNHFLAKQAEYTSDPNEVIWQLRQGLSNWETEITVHYKTKQEPNQDMMFDFIDQALAETGDPAQGDYLRYNMGNYGFSYSYYSNGSEYVCDIIFQFGLFTTAQQEAQLTAKLQTVMDSFGFTDETTDYQKIKTIYDYLTANITYDYTNLNNPDHTLKYSAYAALMHGTSVCQGYASLFYRMAKMAGISVRVISGWSSGEGHAWNIARLGSQYYNLDATWDAGRTNYDYFLRGENTFPDHYRSEEYDTDQFHGEYPMSQTDYQQNSQDPCQVYGHQLVTIPGVDPTCTNPGQTDAAVCQVCQQLITFPQTIPALEHKEKIIPAVSATCTEPGQGEGIVCEVCQTVILSPELLPALGHKYQNGFCSVCKAPDPEYVAPTEPAPTQPAPTEPAPTQPAPTEPEDDHVELIRIAGSNRWKTSLDVAEALKIVQGIDRFPAVIVANGNDFADALAGTYLATRQNIPILVTHVNNDKIMGQVKEYIRANVVPGGMVYVLGGEKAVDPKISIGLESYNVQRLFGSNRYKTNIEVLKATGLTGGSRILVATGRNFADSLSASATGLPILMVHGNLKLQSYQTEYLNSLGTNNEFIIIGGTSAVNDEVAHALGAYGTVTRIEGKNRFETSVKVARYFFGEPQAAVLAYAQNFPDGLCGGPLANFLGGPLILTAGGRESVAVEYVQEKQIPFGLVLGGEGLISDEIVLKIFSHS